MSIYTVRAGGSGRGVSYWKKWGGCARKAYLDDLGEEDRAKTGDIIPQNDKAMIGTLIHALLELWRNRAIEEAQEVQFEFASGQEVHESCVNESRRVAQWYFNNRSVDDLGKVVETEIYFENPKSIRVKPVTGMIDLLTWVDDCEEYNKLHGTSFVEPGHYIHDYKTVTSFRDNDLLEWANSPQLMLYNIALRDAGYDIKGVAIEQIARTKVPKSRIIQLPRLMDSDIEVVNHYFEMLNARRILAHEHDYAPCNVDFCFNWSRQCYYRGKGCTRT